MVNVIVNKDGTLQLTPLIANVSDKGVVESLYITYDKQSGTLLYLIYTGDYDATHTKLVSANNTVSLNSYKSSSLQIQLKSINAASGEVVFESQWATLQLANVETDCNCDYPRPPMFGPCGPHTPPPHHGFKPPKNYLYDFCSKLHTALGVEITNREQGDAKLAEMISSGNGIIADTVSEVIDKLDEHLSNSVIEGYEEELDTYREGVYRIVGYNRPNEGEVIYSPFDSYYVFCSSISFMSDWHVGPTIWQTRISGQGVAVRRYEVDNSPAPPPTVDPLPDIEYDDIFEINEASEPAVASISDNMFSGGNWTMWSELLSSDSGYNRSQVDAKIKTLVEVDEDIIDQIEANSAAIERLQKKRVVGFATMKPLVESVTSQFNVAYVGDLIQGTNYTYTLKRGDDEVVSWQKQSANDTSSSVTVATSLLISEGNTIVIKDGEELVCEAELEIYNLNETIMLQLVAYSE